MKVYKDLLSIIGSYLSLYEIKSILGKKNLYKAVKTGNYPKEEIFQNLQDFTTSCNKGNLDLVQVYIKYGYEPKPIDLYWAIYGGKLKLVKYLYKECKLKLNRDHLIIAVDKKAIRILEYFRKCGIFGKYLQNKRDITLYDYNYYTASAYTKVSTYLLNYSIEAFNIQMTDYFRSVQ